MSKLDWSVFLTNHLPDSFSLLETFDPFRNLCFFFVINTKKSSQRLTVLDLLTDRNEGYDCKKVTSVKINQILRLVAVKCEIECKTSTNTNSTIDSDSWYGFINHLLMSISFQNLLSDWNLFSINTKGGYLK